MSVYQYPDGSISGVVARVRGNGGLNPESWWQTLDESDKEADNRRRVSSRARGQLMRLVRRGNLRRLLTFTNGARGEGWRSYQDAIRDVMRWYREWGGCGLLVGTPIVLVAERGKDGRIHVHGAIRGGYYFNYSAVIHSYSAYMESIGYHSTVGTHRFHSGDENGKHRDGFTSARWCARYMAKYLSKTFEDERKSYEHRYLADGIKPPEPDKCCVGSIAETQATVLDTWDGAEVEWFEDADGRVAGFWFEWEPPPG